MYCELCGITLDKLTRQELKPYQSKDDNSDLKQFMCKECYAVYREAESSPMKKGGLYALLFAIMIVTVIYTETIMDYLQLWHISHYRILAILLVNGGLAYLQYILKTKSETYEMISRKEGAIIQAQMKNLD